MLIFQRIKLEDEDTRGGEHRQTTVEQDSLDVYSPKEGRSV